MRGKKYFKEIIQISLSAMNHKSWSRIIFVLAIGITLAACTPTSNAPVADYSTQIIGIWSGTDGSLKETMSLHRDSTFVCYLHKTGFIATTLSQPLVGTISGRWQINGAKITMQVTGEKRERVENSNASSTILAFKHDSLALKSDRGGISVFRREQNP
jgi:hypothetical protein